MARFARLAARAAPAIISSPFGGVISGLQQTSGGIVWLGRSKAGPFVSQTTAPQVSAFYRCVRIIAAACGAFPLHVYEPQTDDQGRTYGKLVQSVFDELLWGMPNPEHVPMVFWRLVFGHLASAGNAYIYVPSTGQLPEEMWPLAPDRVVPLRNKAGEKVYMVDGRIALTDFINGGEIIHVPGFGYDGLKGYNPIELAANALGLAMAAEEYAAGVFSDGGVPGGTLQTDQKLSKTDADALRDRWEELHSVGAGGKSHRTAVLDSGMTYQEVSVTPETAQLLETRKFQVVEIARMMGVPPHLVGDVERSTSWGSGIEEQARGFVTFTLEDYYVPAEQTITHVFLAGTPRYAKFNTGALLRGNLLERYQTYEIGIRSRVLNPNDARVLEELAPYEGGDDYYLNAGMEQIGMIDNSNDNPNPSDVPSDKSKKKTTPTDTKSN